MKTDIIIASMNRQPQVKICISAIRRTFLKEQRIIVVDYGSSHKMEADALPENSILVRAEADRWNESIAKNIGVAFAETEHVVIMNADIIIPEMSNAPKEIEEALLKKRHVYWLRLDLTQEYSKKVTDTFLNNSDFNYDEYIGAKENKTRTTTATGDFLFVNRNEYMSLGGYDERMYGHGAMDNDLCGRFIAKGLEEVWINKPKILHQHHEPQPNQKETAKANRIISASSWEMVRNDGIKTFDKYKGLKTWQR